MVLVGDLNYLDDYLEVMGYYIEDYYHPGQLLPHTYTERNVVKLVDKSARSDSSLSTLYIFHFYVKENGVNDFYMISLILPRFPYTLFPSDVEIAERLDYLYYCNLFYMTFEPIKQKFSSKAETFINGNYLIITGSGSSQKIQVLPGHTH